MYKIGDRVVYGIHGVCAVVALEKRTVDRKQVEYFALEPLDQPGARFYVPTQNQAALAKLRPVLTPEALETLLASDAVRQNAWIQDEGRRKQYYRELINSGDRGALLAMVGSLYRHKEEQAALGRKFHLCDENFLRDAQKLLNSEFALVLGLEPNQVGDYLRGKLSGKECPLDTDRSAC